MGIATSISKAKRTIQKAVTGEEPAVDILETLKEEHEEVADLLNRLVDGKSSAERRSLFKQVKAALVPHARAEEKVLYNAIINLRKKGVQKDGEEGYLEHGLADKMIATLGKISKPMSPEFSAAAKVLKELIEHHVAEEESAVWSDAKRNFTVEQRRAMNVTYLKAKKAVRIPG
ncbi:MAG TPA: hemerythrin domain-containing protein [Rhizomicrobium sp.]|jgi:hemerythrin superfamily protein